MVGKGALIGFTVLVFLAGTARAGDIPLLPRETLHLDHAPCLISVTSPTLNQQCYVKQTCPIAWDPSGIQNYATVFLHVIQIDAQHPQGWEGGGYPVANTGNYPWVIPENIGPLTGTSYRIRVVTPDRKCSGRSAAFTINAIPPILRIPAPIQQRIGPDSPLSGDGSRP